MSNITNAITVVKDGFSLTSGITSVTTALPVNSAGVPANIVRVICPDTSTAPIHIAFGSSTVVATANSCAVGQVQEYFDVSGTTHFAVIQGITAASFTITPIEW